MWRMPAGRWRRRGRSWRRAVAGCLTPTRTSATRRLPRRWRRCSSEKEKGVYVFYARYEDGNVGAITLDSGAGVGVWPKGMKASGEMLPKDVHLKMIAANGAEIKSDGQKAIKFHGKEVVDASGFARRS